MAAATAQSVLKYIEDIKASRGGRSCSIPLTTISAALGVPENTILTILESLKERGKVHEVSRGSWCTGTGFGR